MFVKELGRSCEIVNLDFANDILPYRPAVDVRDLISLQVKLNVCDNASGKTLFYRSVFSGYDGGAQTWPERRPDILHGIFAGERGVAGGANQGAEDELHNI
jgi:hypothetical protein